MSELLDLDEVERFAQDTGIDDLDARQERSQAERLAAEREALQARLTAAEQELEEHSKLVAANRPALARYERKRRLKFLLRLTSPLVAATTVALWLTVLPHSQNSDRLLIGSAVAAVALWCAASRLDYGRGRSAEGYVLKLRWDYFWYRRRHLAEKLSRLPAPDSPTAGRALHSS